MQLSIPRSHAAFAKHSESLTRSFLMASLTINP